MRINQHLNKLLCLFLAVSYFSVAATPNMVSENDSLPQKEIIKKGISFGPLPVVAFDQDKGFQYGGLLNLFDYGDGSYYPHPRQQWYIEASVYTKGTQQYFLTYDTKHLIPNIRMSLAATCMYDKAMDFYGFNGYQAWYDYENQNYWKKQKDKTGIQPEYMTAFYRVQRLAIAGKADFVGNIWKKKLFWQASYYFSWIKYSSIDRDKINKGRDSVEMFHGETLYDKYINWGIISAEEKKGGITSAVKVGILYDTRNFEAAPQKGIWAEANITLAPHFLGTTHAYARYMAIFRHYVPIVKERLVFAYRLNYQGSIGTLPYYIMPVFSTIGREYDRDGIGGYRTVRGIMRDRVQGLDVGFFNAEFRWKMVSFPLWKQNIYLGLNAFLDGGIVTRKYDITFGGDADMMVEYNKYIDTSFSDKLHLAAGGGFRIAINQNFIIAIDYAVPLDHQDGKGSLYINTGFLF